jgi:Fungal chitosanase of glycosyl hydrolase group 75
MAEAGMGIHLTFSSGGTASSKGRQGGSFLTKVSGGLYGPAIVFQCILNEDVDGAPNCYARFNKATPDDRNGGLDFLRNGTNDENARFTASNRWLWNGVVARESSGGGVEIDEQPDFLQDAAGKYPVFQPGKRFYVCRTALAANNLPETNQAAHFDATRVSYGALTPPLHRLGVRLGDFGIAIRNDDPNNSEAFLYADAGSQDKVGEMSSHLFRKMFPQNNQEHFPVTFIVFPGSATTPTQQASAIKAKLFGLSLADNISELTDVMASGQTFDDFSAAGATLVNSPARTNILNALVKHGGWRHFHDMAYNFDPPGNMDDLRNAIRRATARPSNQIF